MKPWLKRLAFILTGLALLFFSLVGPVNTSPLADQHFYQAMMQRLDTLKPTDLGIASTVQASWGKINITPGKVMPMAGYRIRPQFDSVHDSLYARVIHIENERSVFFISLDLLLFPPALKQKLEEKLKARNEPSFLYLSATHTHNGLGAWYDSPAGEIILGEYDAEWIDDLAKRLIALMDHLTREKQITKVYYWQSSAQEYVENRISANSPADGFLRGIHLVRADSSKAKLITFSAHPTNIRKSVNSLSGDYPAFLINRLEERNVFGLFMAGMVGSHRLTGIHEPETGFEKATQAGQVLAEKVMLAQLEPVSSVEMKGAHIPIEFGPSQLRLTKNLKLRNWVFSWAFGPLSGELTYLQLGNLRFIGTPCDFSGEIFIAQQLNSLSEQYHTPTIITSFNGNYVGYITEDTHYLNGKHEELTTLNWVGPYFGQYFTDMIRSLLQP